MQHTKSAGKPSRPAPPRLEQSRPRLAAPIRDASDEDLMRQTQRGDRQAFSILYERYSGAILTYLHRVLGNFDDVEGVCQEVFLRAFRFAPTYRYPHKFSTWLFTIARNLSFNSLLGRTRSPGRSAAKLNPDTINPNDGQTPSARVLDDLEKREEIARVLEAMEGLSEKHREVIVLGILHDLTYAQMQRIVGAKAVTLRSRMFHGLKNLAVLSGC